MLTELEMRANEEARHSHRELVEELEAKLAREERRNDALEQLRPVWAQGWTRDSMAAQASANALSQLWKMLGVQDQTQAADRIKELDATLAEALECNEEFSMDNKYLKKRAEAAEAKLAKAVGALEKVQDFVRDLEPYADQGHTLVPALREACETLKEIKGETDA